MRKSTRLSSTGLSAMVVARDPVKNFSSRFSLTSYVKRVQQLTDEQRAAITKMGFGNLLLVPNHSLSKNLLAELMERWDCAKKTFLLHSGEISMTLLDVALILGLRVVGNPVLLKDDEPFSDLEEDYGATVLKRKVTIASLERRLDSHGEIVNADFIRTFLLYTIGTCLFPNSNWKVDTRYLSFLRNLDDVCQYAWGAAVIEDLSNWLIKRKEDNVQYVGGCLIFLQTWSYEHFDIARPHLQGYDMTFPRVCRWDNRKSHQRQWFTSRFTDLNDDQVIWTLQPTSEELEIDIIKELLELQGDSKELRSAENSSSCTPIEVPRVDLVLKQVTSNALDGEHEADFENPIILEDTPAMSRPDEVHRGHSRNEPLQFVPRVDLVLNQVTSNALDGEHKDDSENPIILGDTPAMTRHDEVHREHQYNFEKPIITQDSPTMLRNSDEVHREHKVNSENLIIVEDTPSSLGSSHEIRIEYEGNFENLVVEDTPTKSSSCEEEDREHEVNLENLVVEDTPTNSGICDVDLRKRFAMIEEENVKLKQKMSQIVEENSFLRNQMSLNSQLEGQNAELKNELENVREENRVLRLSVNNFMTKMDRLISSMDANESE